MLYGVASMVMAFLAKNMGGVLQIAIGVYGGCTGPVLAIFILALFVPFSNPKVGGDFVCLRYLPARFGPESSSGRCIQVSCLTLTWN